jgi:creatinine amidohydrolase/Fe(II)-dependent formamide hydrolase-like protein
MPIGAAAKQHGFHLPLNTDRIQPNGSQANWRRSMR